MKSTFLNLFFSFLAIITFAFLSEVQAAEWYKGQLHCHSHWSDGNVLPEQAITWYKNHGYHFVCLSDHGILQLDSNRWKEVSEKAKAVLPALIDDSKKKFGDDWCEIKTEDGNTFVRLKTFTELASKLNEEGKFVLIPGHEQNSRLAGIVLHANAINVTETIPFPDRFPSLYSAALAWRQASLDNSAKSGLEGLWILNHPYWPYYDVSPDVLIEASDIEFYENRNVSAAPEKQHPLMDDEEKYWDTVNSFRILNGNKPIYGVTSDDTHDYLTFREQHPAIPGEGWIVVRSEKLDADSLIRGMKKGDFYGSTGVVLKDIRFDPVEKTLTVKVDPADNVQYTIRFVGTKKGFDTNKRAVELPAEGRHTARQRWAYSEQIGVTFQMTSGNEATYRMAPDDLYVRAIVTSNRKPPYESVNKPEWETAWTQPVGW